MAKDMKSAETRSDMTGELKNRYLRGKMGSTSLLWSSFSIRTCVVMAAIQGNKLTREKAASYSSKDIGSD